MKPETKKILGIIERVLKNKAVGIIYDIPKNDSIILQHKLLDKNHIVLNGSDVFTSAMLRFRLGQRLKIKYITFKMIPGLINGNIIVIADADMIKSSYSKVIDDFNKYKIPLLLLMKNGESMKNFRMLKYYSSVLTIEQNYKDLQEKK